MRLTKPLSKGAQGALAIFAVLMAIVAWLWIVHGIYTLLEPLRMWLGIRNGSFTLFLWFITHVVVWLAGLIGGFIWLAGSGDDEDETVQEPAQ